MRYAQLSHLQTTSDLDRFLHFWFDASPQGAAIFEPIRSKAGHLTSFRFLLVNPVFATILGQTPQELIGYPLSAVNLEDSANPVLQALLRAIQAIDPTGQFDHFSQFDHGLAYHVTVNWQVEKQLMLVSIQDIAEQKKANHDLQRHLAIESIVSAIAGRLMTLEAGELDRYIIDALAQISMYNGADRAALFWYSEDQQRGSCIHEWCAPGIPSSSAKLQDLPLVSFAWLHDQLASGQVRQLSTDNLPEQAANEQAIFKQIDVRSMVLVPLVQTNRTVGFIGFYAIRATPPWDAKDIDLLQTFSALLVSARQRQQQQSAIQRANQRLQGLHTIDQALLRPQSTDHSSLLVALQHLNALVPCERLTLFRINPTTGLATAEYRLAEGVLEMNNNLCFAARYITDLLPGHIHYFPDLQVKSIRLPPDVKLVDWGFRSLVVVPLYNGDDCTGAFTLVSVAPAFFTEEYRQIAQEVAYHLAYVSNQQQQDKRLKQQNEDLEQRVEERTQAIQQLSALHQAILNHAGQAIVSTDINGVIQTANQATETLTGYSASELMGRVAQLNPGSSPNAIPFLSYKHQRPVELSSPSPTFQTELDTQGHITQECIVIGKDGRQVPILMASSVLQADDGTTIGYVGIATNISALKEAEYQLRQKNRELHTFFEGALDMHCISDSQGKLLTINQAFQSALGYTEAELKAIPFLQLVHPDEQKFIYHQRLLGILNQPVRNQISQFRKKDGTYRIIEWNAIGIDELVYGSARDITDRQRDETQLRNLNQRLQLATRAAGQGVWEIDYAHDQLIWDERLWEMHGIEPARDGWRFADYLPLLHPDDRASFLTSYPQNLTQETIWNVTRIIQPNGSVRYLENSGLVIRDEQGLPVRAIGVSWDVTQSTLAEAALRESEQRFQEIAENVDEVFWIHSVEPFELLYINSAYERVFGISPQDDLTGEYSFLDTVLTEDRDRVRVEFDKYRQGQEVVVQCRVKGTHPHVRWIQIKTFVMTNSQGVAVRYIGIVNDITSQKETEFILKQSLQREQELNQLKSQFVSIASHEFRTPLTTIQSSVDLIKLYLKLPLIKARRSIHPHLDVIQQEIERFTELLNDLLTIGKIEAGKVNFNPRLVDITQVCERLISTHFSKRTDQRSVEIQLIGTPRLVYIDDVLIGHVLVNLLSNAFKFSDESPLLRVIFQARDLRLEVIDTGIGIPIHDHPILFQAFARASNAGSIPGTGLGLVIARQFIELHNGSLTLASNKQKGARFIARLPNALPGELGSV